MDEKSSHYKDKQSRRQSVHDAAVFSAMPLKSVESDHSDRKKNGLSEPRVTKKRTVIDLDKQPENTSFSAKNESDHQFATQDQKPKKDQDSGDKTYKNFNADVNPKVLTKSVSTQEAEKLLTSVR